MNKGDLVKWADPENDHEKSQVLRILDDLTGLGASASVHVQVVYPKMPIPQVMTVRLRDLAKQ
jgi:hypothetical protein